MTTLQLVGSRAQAALTSQRFSNVTIFGLLVLIVLAFTVLAPDGSFTSSANIDSLLLSASQLLLVAAGVTFLLIAGGLDLSVGAVVVFSSVVAATIMRDLTSDLTNTMTGGSELWVPILLGCAAGVVVGGCWGVVNGLLVQKSHIPPFIVTLAMNMVVLGLAQVWTDGINVDGVPRALQDVYGLGRMAGIPLPVVTAAAVTGVLWVILSQTRFGLRTYAIGANAEAARRSGINVDRHLLAIYGLVGTMAGLVGVIDVARFTTATINGYTTLALQAITAVVIGGTSLWGGRGRMSGTIVGALIPATLTSGFVVMGIQPFWQNVALGCVLLLAVFVDQYRRRHLTTT